MHTLSRQFNLLYFCRLSSFHPGWGRAIVVVNIVAITIVYSSYINVLYSYINLCFFLRASPINVSTECCID